MPASSVAATPKSAAHITQHYSHTHIKAQPRNHSHAEDDDGAADGRRPSAYDKHGSGAVSGSGSGYDKKPDASRVREVLGEDGELILHQRYQLYPGTLGK